MRKRPFDAAGSWVEPNAASEWLADAQRNQSADRRDVHANRGKEPFFCRNVQIINNVTAGTGILMAGQPGENNVIKGNRHVGPTGKIVNAANAEVGDNEGYTVSESEK